MYVYNILIFPTVREKGQGEVKSIVSLTTPFKRQLVKYLSNRLFLFVKKVSIFSNANESHIFSNENNNKTMNICTFETVYKALID